MTFGILATLTQNMTCRRHIGHVVYNAFLLVRISFTFHSRCKYMQYLHCMIVSKILCSINAYKTFSIISRGFKLLKNDCLNINDILCFRRDRLHVRLFFLKYIFFCIFFCYKHIQYLSVCTSMNL